MVLETFYLSNMTPQEPKLNREGWEALEERVRNWASTRGEVWVITGPAFVDENRSGRIAYKTIGANHVAVPTHYYKIVIADRQGQPDVIAFLIPNQPLPKTADFKRFLVSVRRIEDLTGLNFMPELNDSTAAAVEANEATELW